MRILSAIPGGNPSNARNCRRPSIVCRSNLPCINVRVLVKVHTPGDDDGTFEGPPVYISVCVRVCSVTRSSLVVALVTNACHFGTNRNNFRNVLARCNALYFDRNGRNGFSSRCISFDTRSPSDKKIEPEASERSRILCECYSRNEINDIFTSNLPETHLFDNHMKIIE